MIVFSPGASESLARSLLAACDGSLEMAINMHMEDGADATTSAATTVTTAAMAASAATTEESASASTSGPRKKQKVKKSTSSDETNSKELEGNDGLYMFVCLFVCLGGEPPPN